MDIIATRFKGVFHTCKVTEVWLVLLLMKSVDETGFLVKWTICELVHTLVCSDEDG